MKLQNYRNHRFFEPTFYYFLFPMILILLLAIVTEWVQFSRDSQSLWETVVLTVIELTVIILSIRMRLYALIAQDRAIRAEEQIRHYVLSGQLLDARLNIRQIVALRFASDEEFPTLAKRAADENLSSDQIKRAIGNWRADWHRV